MKKIGLLLTMTLASLCATGCDLSDLDAFFATEEVKKDEVTKDEGNNKTQNTEDNNKQDEQNGEEGQGGDKPTGGEGGSGEQGQGGEGGSGEQGGGGQTVTSYMVTLYPNGGTSDVYHTSTNGSQYTLPHCSFVNEGYTFSKWALGSPSGTQYAINDTVYNISSDIEFYALWVEKGTGEFDGYYDSISDSDTGNTLRAALHELNEDNIKKLVTYAGLRDFAKYCDADPNGSGKILGFYDNSLIGPNWDSGSTWNREHVWPNSRGGGLVENDVHMARPASVSENSGRGSKGYGTESYDPGYKIPYYRGVCSRIIFYCMIANTNLKLSEDPFNHDYNGSDPSNTMGCLSDMLRWNLAYLPSDTTLSGNDDIARRAELNRNDVIQKHASGQGNRNPFIDHPEYACRIWGDTNDTTRSICGGH